MGIGSLLSVSFLGSAVTGRKKVSMPQKKRKGRLNLSRRPRGALLAPNAELSQRQDVVNSIPTDCSGM